MWQEHRPHHVQRYMQQNPYRLLALSFLAVMAVGTILLMLPIASAQGKGTALVDAAFTAVSCVSVTGLAIIIGRCLAKSSWSSLFSWVDLVLYLLQPLWLYYWGNG